MPIQNVVGDVEKKIADKSEKDQNDEKEDEKVEPLAGELKTRSETSKEARNEPL